LAEPGERRDGSRQRQTLTIPMHREIDRGTLQAIYRQTLRYLTHVEIAPFFFAES
jgi:hypothetical protein